MKFMTKEIEKKIPALYETDGKGKEEDKICYVKFFHPMCNMTWYAVEFNPQEGLFFGWVQNGDYSEWGYFSLGEMQSLVVRGLGMERDMYFDPKPMSEIAEYQKYGMR